MRETTIKTLNQGSPKESPKSKVKLAPVDKNKEAKGSEVVSLFEPRHDKTNKVTVRPAKTQISLGIRRV